MSKFLPLRVSAFATRCIPRIEQVYYKERTMSSERACQAGSLPAGSRIIPLRG
jgi:hypothetical protein